MFNKAGNRLMFINNNDRRNQLRRAEDKSSVSALLTQVAVLDARLVTVMEQQAKIIETNKEEHVMIQSRLDKTENSILVLDLEAKWSKRVILILLGLLAVDVFSKSVWPVIMKMFL